MTSDRRARTGHDQVSRREVFKTAAAVVAAPFLLRDALAAQSPAGADAMALHRGDHRHRAGER